jgi:hypothetical protein
VAEAVRSDPTLRTVFRLTRAMGQLALKIRERRYARQRRRSTWRALATPWAAGEPGELRPEEAIDAAPGRVSFLLPLPFEIPAEGDITVTLFGRGHFRGWEDVQVSPLPWLPATPWPGLRPMTSLWIRRGRGLAADMTAPVLDAFAPLFAGSKQVEQEPQVEVDRAVAQITRIAPSDAEGGEAWLSDQFDASLNELNQFLVVLAAVTQDPSIGPIAVQELPSAVVFFTEAMSIEDLEQTHVAPEPSLLMIHPGTEGLAPTISEEQLHRARAVHALQHGPGHPFFPYAEAMVSARHALLHGRNAQAVLEAGTAIEILASAVIREVATRRGLDQERVQAIREQGLRNRLDPHLGTLVGISIDLNRSNDAVGRWYNGAYRLRNRIVHEGYRPSVNEASDALREARDFVATVGRGLYENSDTREIGELLVAFREEH